MAQIDIRTKEASTFVGIETTFGTTPTMTRAFPIAGTVAIETSVTELENESERTRLYSYLPTIRGIEDGTVKMEMHVKPFAVKLSASADVGVHPVGVVLKSVMGGEAAVAGSALETGNSETVLNVTPGTGTLFAVGAWVSVTGAIQECAKVVSVATDAVTVSPAFSSAPSAGGALYSAYNYHMTPANTQTLTVQHALVGSTDYQWTLNGCMGSVGVSLKRNELAKITYDGKVGSHTGPSNQSIVTTVAAETMNSPFVVKDAICLFQAVSAGTRTHYPVESFELKINPGLVYLEELGGTEGKTGVMRTGERMAAEATLKFRADSVIDTTNWSSQTPMTAVVMVPQGTGATRRWFIVDIGTAYIVGKPKFTDEGGRLICEVKINATEDATGAHTAVTDLALSPVKIALI